MKGSVILLSICIFLFWNCNTNEANKLPIILNQEYNFQVGKVSKFFTPERSNKITFFQNGTYTRTEDTGNAFDARFPKAIMITDLVGNWEFVDGVLILNDKEIKEFHCISSIGAAPE